MSFFGFERSSLEQEKKKFLEGGFQETEDLAVYTWGEESYDGLGDALLEGGDELNDETFGEIGAVGKDFDFTSQTLPTSIGATHGRFTPTAEPFRERTPVVERAEPALKSRDRAPKSLESIWDDKSSFSMLSRAAGHQRVPSNLMKSPFPPSRSPALNIYADHRPLSQQQPISHGINQTGVRTLQEIEAEMRAAQQKRKQQEEMLLQSRRQEDFRLQELERQDLQRLQQENLLADRMRARLEQEQQLRLQQQARMPTPRVVPHLAPSPRFNQQHQHQQQILLLQQEQERQQQERLKELQERLRMEELERQLRAQQLSQLQQQQPNLLARRQSPYADTQRRTHSPVIDSQYVLFNQQNTQYIPQSIQLQQRLLSEMAQVEFMRDMQGISQAEQEALRVEAMRKIMETERMEERRRRKAAKIAHMSRYNDLMTQSDKDFITRIQVSQLVTQDPYAEDFYAQVYGAILRSRLGLQSQDERVIKFGSSGGVGLGLAQKGSGRRQSAMQKMEAQVERIVNNARLREKEKGLHSLHSLQGALGKTSGRSYKAAPRQLLQVDASSATPTMSGTHPHISKEGGNGAAQEAAKLGREALGQAAGSDGVVRKDPLTQRQTLVVLEGLYDLVLNIEQLRRDQPLEEDEEDGEAFVSSATYNDLVEQIWMNLKVMLPLETSDPHPFVSLLTPVKGKKILPRLSRHITPPRMLTLLTLLVACFSQLDVVKRAAVLDSLEETPERQDIERQTQAFLGSVLQSILPVVAKAELRVITGLLGLLLDRTNIIVSAQTRPGIAILTLFLSRVEIVKQGMSSAQESSEIPTPAEAQQWQTMFDHLFQLLMPHFVLLFPSTRLVAQPLPTAASLPPTDILDQPVWQFLAALALHASSDQQSILVTNLREKVLDIVTSVSKGWVADEEERQTKLANVNLFLHALGLDSSQISV
ncbi:topoisomerase II-associated protein PAT1 [Suillus bovinus]|uniref:topoisomerase II-associated protein PAT1 n=1 Tax=Suillus bovinus TaxID=48563 RepID=UPI001B87AB38|nr:topoisomerase II-associated protein PAT1 [Suillus bovinus]KAG2150307.1 topoisomerase II-associated protein PAT1 [Suillus bovinus]